MLSCSGCQRHIREDESNCPFCGAPQRSAPSPFHERVGVLGVLVMGASLLGSVGCGQGNADSAATTGTSDTTEDTSSETTLMGAETETDTGDEPDDSNNTSGGFYGGPDTDIGGVSLCDPWLKDCPEGEKCVPYASTGQGWSANKCVPIVGNGQVGELCTYDGWVEATDSCGGDSHCWHVTLVDGVNVGTCTPFCVGTPDEPQCPEDTACLISGEGSINLCLDTCNPLTQNCAEELGCYWAAGDFLCVLPGETVEGGSCSAFDDCEAGNTCLTTEVLLDCADEACCAPFCDLMDPDACSDPGLECVPFLEFPPPGEGLEDLGVCIVPDA